MQIEVNRDIDKFKESVVLGLTARQLAYSVVSVIVGAAVVLGIYPYVGLTISAYIAVPIVSPIALTGFYSFNEMTFIEMMKKKIRFTFGSENLPYVSTEDISEIEQIRTEIEAKTKAGAKMTMADRILAHKDKKGAGV